MPNPFPPVAINGDWFTVGGEKFLAVAVGYESYSRAGQAPWMRKFEPDVIREDFRRIQEAGYNTIRTWTPMSDEELALAEEFGFWVIQGLWIKVDADFNDPAFRKESFDFYEKELTRLAKHPNILCYLLLNEPHGDAVHRAGTDRMNEFYEEIIHLARRCDPKRTFSYSNCVITDYLVPTMWDFTAQNAYPYSPGTIQKALGYRSYLEWVKRALAPGKPLLITEYGLSVSPHGDGRGYGNNTLEEQRDGIIRMTDDLLSAGAVGYCTFMWTDGWWKDGNPDKHDPGPEEWYGLIETDSDYLGRPRPAYFAIQEYNKAVRVLPRDGHVVSGDFPVEVWAPHAGSVQYRIDEGSWVDLKRHGSWWKSVAALSGLADGPHYVWTRADIGGLKSAIVEVDRSGRNGDFLHVRLVDLPERVPLDAKLEVVVEITDRDGQPAPGRKVRVERFLHTRWEERGVEVETGPDGRAVANLGRAQVPGILSIAAAATYTNGLLNLRFGDYRHLEVMGR